MTAGTAVELACRDDAWLADRVELLRRVHFADVPQGYPITTRFGIRARNRFGSIGARGRQTTILINRLFAEPAVPTYVVDGTLAHELAHYAHGYGSGLPLLYPDPHRGGVVDKELERRGLGGTNLKAEQWRKLHWERFYEEQCADLHARRNARQEARDQRWRLHLQRPGQRTDAHLRARLALLSPRFGFADPPFDIEWLCASPRQCAPSYWFSKSCVVRLHGLRADPRVPACVIDYEVGYWLAHCAAGSSMEKIYRALTEARLATAVGDALNWRRRSWNAFRTRNHPLKR